jgi:hypothetical protein
MKANVVLSNEEIQLIFEALDHLYFESQRASQERHVDHLPKLKKHFLNKKEKTKKLRKRIADCTGKINYLTSI